MPGLSVIALISALTTILWCYGVETAKADGLGGLARCGQQANSSEHTLALSTCDGVIEAGELDGVLLSTAYFYRGLAYRTAGDLDAAIQDFDTALLLAQVSLYYFERGLAYQVRGDLDAAIADFDTALWMRPDDSRVFDQRGETHWLKGDLLAARLDFDAAHMRDPDLFPLDGDARMARNAAWDR